MKTTKKHGASLRPNHAAEFLGIGRTTLWRWSKERADFPKPRHLSARCVVFDMDELAQWRDAQKKELKHG